MDCPEDFSCLFCYCPLYALADRCGGCFTYLENGIKDCSACLVPHRRENFDRIMEKMPLLLELAKKGTRAVSLAHLSADNNLPELAYNTVCEALCSAGYAVGSEISVTVARRDRVSDMLILEGEEADAV